MRLGWQHLLSFIHSNVSPSLVQATPDISDVLNNSFQQQQGRQYFGFFMLHFNLLQQVDTMHLNLLGGVTPPK